MARKHQLSSPDSSPRPKTRPTRKATKPKEQSSSAPKKRAAPRGIVNGKSPSVPRCLGSVLTRIHSDTSDEESTSVTPGPSTRPEKPANGKAPRTPRPTAKPLDLASFERLYELALEFASKEELFRGIL